MYYVHLAGPMAKKQNATQNIYWQVQPHCCKVPAVFSLDSVSNIVLFCYTYKSLFNKKISKIFPTDENQQASTFQLPLFTLQNKKPNCNSNKSKRKTFWFYTLKRNLTIQLIPFTLKIRSLPLRRLKRSCSKISNFNVIYLSQVFSSCTNILNIQRFCLDIETILNTAHNWALLMHKCVLKHCRTHFLYHKTFTILHLIPAPF